MRFGVLGVASVYALLRMLSSLRKRSGGRASGSCPKSLTEDSLHGTLVGLERRLRE